MFSADQRNTNKIKKLLVIFLMALNIHFLQAAGVIGGSEKNSARVNNIRAGNSPSYTGSYREHGGVFFRYVDNLSVGYGFQSFMFNKKQTEMSTWSQTISLDLGYTLGTNLAFFLGAGAQKTPPSGSGMFYPSLSSIIYIFWNPFQGLSTPIIELFQCHAGFNYYFMPHNYYISLTAGPSWMKVTSNGSFSESETGLSLQLFLGKEWWTGTRWSTGVALVVAYNYFPRTRKWCTVITPFHSFLAGLAVSATYN